MNGSRVAATAFALPCALAGVLMGMPVKTPSAVPPEHLHRPKHSYRPKNGFVPDKQTAIRIAEAVWIPIYGRARVQMQKPFLASLAGGVWTVSGTVKRVKGRPFVGGVAYIEIAKSDGRVLRVTHSL